MKIQMRHPYLPIVAADYSKYLDMFYDEFCIKTCMDGTTDEGYHYHYEYCVAPINDSKKARLSYINYLVNEKSFDLL